MRIVREHRKLADYIQKFIVPQRDKPKSFDGEVPWCRIEDIDGVYLSKSKSGKCVSQKAIEEMPLRVFPRQTVIVSCSADLGRCAIVSEPLVTNQTFIGLVPKVNLDPLFLYYLMTSRAAELNASATGATIKYLSQDKFRDLDVSVPPLPEQQRIVGALDKAFENIATARADAEKNLKNARALFASHLSTVFTKRGSGWVQKRLGDVCTDIFAGGDVPKDNLSKTPTVKHPIPIYTNGEKNNGLYGYTNTARVTSPSLTISARGTIGYAAIRNESFYPAIRLIVVIPNQEILDLVFLYYVIESTDIDHSGTSIPQLTVPMVREFPISVPPLSEQKALAGEFDALREETRRLESIYQRKLVELDALKKSLLNAAFSGNL